MAMALDDMLLESNGYDGLVDDVRICTDFADLSGIPELLSISIVVGLGLIGNGLVAFVLIVLREHLKSRPGWILIQMIIANSLYLILFLCTIAEDGIGKWSMNELACKSHTLFTTASINSAILLLVITNIERTITYAGSKFPQRIFSACSATAVRTTSSILIWLACICGSIPHFQLACIDSCGRCSQIHPLSREQICQYLQLNETDCSGFFYEVSRGELYNQFGDDINQDYFIAPQESQGFAYGIDDLPDEFVPNQRNATVLFPCHHDEPPGFFHILYVRFVLLFVLPLASMFGSALALYRYRKQVQPIINNQRDSSTGQWMMTVIAFNCLFLICWIPYHVIDMGRIRGIEASPKTCTILLHYTKFSVVAYHAAFPFLYMCLTRNFKHQILASFATVVYSVVERASKTSDFISMKTAAYFTHRPRENTETATGQ